MVKQYLLNYQQELFENKIDLEKSLQKVEILMKENQEFVRFIQDSEDKSYDSFSPQNYKHDSDMRKKKELKEQQRQLQEEKDNVLSKIENNNQKINELENIINLLKSESENEKDTDEVNSETGSDSSVQEYDRQRMTQQLNTTHQSLTGILHKIELCTKLIDMDRNRCKLELQNLSKIVEETINDMEKVIK